MINLLNLSTLADLIISMRFKVKLSIHFYHGNRSVLIGAPTGSGKTTLAELAMWQALRTNSGKKIIYIAPLKSLVKERLDDWKARLKFALGISVVELTGDITPEALILQKSNLILTTPENGMESAVIGKNSEICFRGQFSDNG